MIELDPQVHATIAGERTSRLANSFRSRPAGASWPRRRLGRLLLAVGARLAPEEARPLRTGRYASQVSSTWGA